MKRKSARTAASSKAKKSAVAAAAADPGDTSAAAYDNEDDEFGVLDLSQVDEALREAYQDATEKEMTKEDQKTYADYKLADALGEMGLKARDALGQAFSAALDCPAEDGGDRELFAHQAEYRRMFAAFPLVLIDLKNYVFTSRLTHRVRFSDVTLHARSLGASVNTKKSPVSLTVHCVAPKCTVLIFEKGSIMCSGGNHESHAERAVDEVIAQLRKLVPSCANLGRGPLVLCNYVGRFFAPRHINVSALEAAVVKSSDTAAAAGAAGSDNGVRFGKRLFSGGISVLSGIRNINMLVYPSGYMVVTGSRDIDFLARSVARVAVHVAPHMHGSVTTSFVTDSRRRYIRDAARLARDAEKCAKKPTSKRARKFVVVMSDGTIGTIGQWLEYTQPRRTVNRVLLSLKGDAARIYGARIEEARRDMAIEAETRGGAEADDNHEQPAAASANVRRDVVARRSVDTTALVAVSSSSTAIEKMHATQQDMAIMLAGNRATVDDFSRAVAIGGQAALQRMADRNDAAAKHALVAMKRTARGVMDAVNVQAAQEVRASLIETHGLSTVLRNEKPTETKLLPANVASDLFAGYDDGNVA